jgi:hypothetical protein
MPPGAGNEPDSSLRPEVRRAPLEPVLGRALRRAVLESGIEVVSRSKVPGVRPADRRPGRVATVPQTNSPARRRGRSPCSGMRYPRKNAAAVPGPCKGGALRGSSPDSTVSAFPEAFTSHGSGRDAQLRMVRNAPGGARWTRCSFAGAETKSQRAPLLRRRAEYPAKGVVGYQRGAWRAGERRGERRRGMVRGEETGGGEPVRKGTAPLSRRRCAGPRGIYFDGDRDMPGSPTRPRTVAARRG